MQLIDGFDLIQALQSCERARFAAFPRAVIDDRDARVERADKRRVVAYVQAVVIGLIDIDDADYVFRTSQTVFDIPRQVATIKEFEPPEGEQNAHAIDVVRLVFRLRFEMLSARSNLGDA